MFSVAKLVGEGYEKPSGDDQVAIDVNYAKIIDWMVDRKLLNSDWNKKLQAIQSNAARASKSLPIELINDFQGSNESDAVDYLHSKEILAKLAETADRGLLGSLKGDAGIWEKIVKAYETQQLFVAESAQILARNVDYEIPFLKKQIDKNQHAMSDLDKRKADSLKSATAAATDFKHQCQELGIKEGSSTQAELQIAVSGLVSSLPELVQQALNSVNAAHVKLAVAHYQAFVAMLDTAEGGGSTPAAVGVSKGSSTKVLGTLLEVQEGRTEAPAPELEIPADDLISTTAGSQHNEEEDGLIDFDIGGGGLEDTTDGATAAAAGISWDFEVVADAGGIENDEATNATPDGISWDIDIDMSASQDEHTTFSVDASGDGGDNQQQKSIDIISSGRKDMGDDVPNVVRRLMWDVPYRTKLLDDLNELQAFLVRRCTELSSKDASLLTAKCSEDIQSVDADLARTMQSEVEKAIAAMNEEKLKQLLMVASSASYRKRLVQSLVRQAGQEQKFIRAASDADSKKLQIQRELMADSAKTKAMIQKTRQLKTLVEQALSAKLNRRVNVQGEINNLTA